MRSAITLAFVFLGASFSAAGCIPFKEAPQHLGESRCIKGKVMHIDAVAPGLDRLSFCQESSTCPLTALVSEEDLKKAGGAKEIEGKTVTIKGLLNEINGNAQIVLRQPGQLSADDEDFPRLLKTYDVEQKGHYSAGTSRAPKAARSTTAKQTATLPIDVPGDVEEAGPSAR